MLSKGLCLKGNDFLPFFQFSPYSLLFSLLLFPQSHWLVLFRSYTLNYAKCPGNRHVDERNERRKKGMKRRNLNCFYSMTQAWTGSNFICVFSLYRGLPQLSFIFVQIHCIVPRGISVHSSQWNSWLRPKMGDARKWSEHWLFSSSPFSSFFIA